MYPHLPSTERGEHGYQKLGMTEVCSQEQEHQMTPLHYCLPSKMKQKYLMGVGKKASCECWSANTADNFGIHRIHCPCHNTLAATETRNRTNSNMRNLQVRICVHAARTCMLYINLLAQHIIHECLLSYCNTKPLESGSCKYAEFGSQHLY